MSRLLDRVDVKEEIVAYRYPYTRRHATARAAVFSPILLSYFRSFLNSHGEEKFKVSSSSSSSSLLKRKEMTTKIL